MGCEATRVALSAAADGELAPADRAVVDAHVERCRGCAAWARDVDALRRAVRYAPAGGPADLAPAVTARLRSRPSPRGRTWLQAAAVFAAAFLAGAAFVGLDVRRPVTVVASVPDSVAAAQRQILGLAAGLEVVERGWHPDVGERRYRGTLRYLAPEHLAVRLEDLTAYPDGRWAANDVEVVAAGSTGWARGLAACPVEMLPGCQPPEPRVRAVHGREPFDPSAPAALDLVLPVQSFARAGEPETIGTRQLDGRGALGVAVDAAQAAPLLDGLRQAGHWRELHPTDRVELWLDAEVLVPLAVTVLPSADPDRELWAARRGYRDEPGQPLLEIRLTGVEVEAAPTGPDGQDGQAGFEGRGGGSGEFPPVPAGEPARELGFRDGPVGGALPAPVPEPGWLPPGMRPHRHGWLSATGGPRIAVATWTDGRAWVKVRATRQWRGGRLFGDLGSGVRPVRLAGHPHQDGDPASQGTAPRIAYVDELGTAVALHAGDLDVVVAGSVGEDVLLRVAESLGVDATAVPEAWEEAASVPLERLLGGGSVLVPAAGAVPEPAVRVAGDTVTLSSRGPGERGFLLVQAPGTGLSPPLHPDVRGVQLRGTTGRYDPSTGELEWAEGGVVASLRSRTLSLPELLAVAESLRWR